MRHRASSGHLTEEEQKERRRTVICHTSFSFFSLSMVLSLFSHNKTKNYYLAKKEKNNGRRSGNKREGERRVKKTLATSIQYFPAAVSVRPTHTLHLAPPKNKKSFFSPDHLKRKSRRRSTTPLSQFPSLFSLFLSLTPSASYLSPHPRTRIRPKLQDLPTPTTGRAAAPAAAAAAAALAA